MAHGYEQFQTVVPHIFFGSWWILVGSSLVAVFFENEDYPSFPWRNDGGYFESSLSLTSGS